MPLVYAGAALTALASVVLSVAQARISAVVVGSSRHFAAGWMAFAGLWVGALLSCGWRGATAGPYRRLAQLAVLSTVAALFSLVGLLHHATAEPTLGLALACAAPFVPAGAALSLAAAESARHVLKAYSFALLGAAGGCLLSVGLLGWLGGPNAAIGAAVLYAASAALWYKLAGSLRGRALAVIGALGLVALVALNARLGAIDVRFAKGEALRGERFVKWNSFCRVAVGGFGPGKLLLRLDAEAAGHIAGGELERLSAAERDALMRRGPGVAYLLRPGAKTLILNPGGGEEVARALAAGSRDVTAVEANAVIADTVMRRRFASASGGLYSRPEVRLVVQDARSFVRQNRDFFQVLQLSPVWAGESAQQFLLTSEAIESYLERLTDDGLFSVTVPSREMAAPSLVAAAARALQRLGARDPGDHLVVVRDLGDGTLVAARDTVIVSRRPLSQLDLDRCRQVITGSSIGLYWPGDEATTMSAALYGSFINGVAPPTDNRPYLVRGAGAQNRLRALAIAGAAAVAVTLALAFLVGARRACLGDPAAPALGFLIFSGAGFLMILTALAGQLGLFLGHASAHLTVVAPALLVSASLGLLAGKSGLASLKSRVAVVAAVALVATALSMVVAPLVSFGAGWPLWVKAMVAVLVAAPAGFLMGMAAAGGLAWLERQAPEQVPWAWTFHAAGAVLGAAAGLLAATEIGLRETMLLGGLAYLGALAVAGWRGRTEAWDPGHAR